MAFTKEEIAVQAKDKRPLKFTKHRKLKGLKTSELIKEAAHRSGYQETATKEVIMTFLNLIEETLLSKRSVTIRGLGLLTPILSKARQVNSFSPKHLGGDGSVKSIITPATFDVKLFSKIELSNKMKQIDVTQEDLDYIYK